MQAIHEVLGGERQRRHVKAKIGLVLSLYLQGFIRLYHVHTLKFITVAVRLLGRGDRRQDRLCGVWRRPGIIG